MTFQSCEISGSASSHESGFYRKSNGNCFVPIPVSIEFPIETELNCLRKQIFLNFEKSQLSNEGIFFDSVKK